MYKGADLFILAVSPDSEESFQNIDKWRNELQLVEPDTPIVLFMNKSDLPNSSEMFARVRRVRKLDPESFTACYKTSAKEWRDFNVYTAFRNSLRRAFEYKYTLPGAEG